MPSRSFPLKSKVEPAAGPRYVRPSKCSRHFFPSTAWTPIRAYTFSVVLNDVIVASDTRVSALVVRRRVELTVRLEGDRGRAVDVVIGLSGAEDAGVLG